MDYIASTLSPDQVDELLQFSSLPGYVGPDVAAELDGLLTPWMADWDVLAGESLLGGPPVAEPLATDPVGGGGGGSSCAHIEQRNPSECIKKRKTVHRDVERQRRQEMASLYGSLRSHLPVELLKGKRSISDHIHQAVRYIENRQSNIQELVAKRDKLKRMSESEKTDGPELADREEDPRTRRPSYIGGIEPCAGGIEITISIDPPHGTALSKVIGFLIHEGMDIISCTSTTLNGRLFHCIKSEVATGNNKSSAYDLSELKNKLMRLLG